MLVLAVPLGAVDALLGHEVADGLADAALADLRRDGPVQAVLDLVDVLVARDLGLVEVIWDECRRQQACMASRRVWPDGKCRLPLVA